MFTFRQNIVCDPYIDVQAFMKVQQKALSGRSSASSTFYQVNPRNLFHTVCKSLLIFESVVETNPFGLNLY